MIKYYNIAGIIIKIECDADFIDTQETQPFLTEVSRPDVEISFNGVNGIAQENGKIIFSSDFVNVYQTENGLVRSFKLSTMSRTAAVTVKDANKYNCLYDTFYKEYFSMAKNLLNAVGLESIFSDNQAFILHCSFVEINSEAILFSGSSGIGKSSRAKLWENVLNAKTVNGDRALIYRKDGKLFASGLPVSGSSKIYLNEQYPLKAIVFLEKSLQNRTAEISPLSAYKKLYKNIVINVWSEDFMKSVDRFISVLCENIKIYKSECNLEEASVFEQLNVINNG